MASINGLDDQFADLDIESEESSELVFEEDVNVLNKYNLCLVRRFLSEKNINVWAMKSKLADVWTPWELTKRRWGLGYSCFSSIIKRICNG